MKRLLIISALLFNQAASAAELSNTFVGNGGNAGDLELQLTLGQIERTARLIVEQPANEYSGFCECPPAYKGRPICQPLESLDSKQVGFCAKNMRENAKEILKLLSAEGGIKFDWSENKMMVSEDGGTRQADAVANTQAKTITIHRDYFVDQRQPERIFLITHELLHFTKANGKFIRDDEPLGPFTDRDGGRNYLNASGSAFAMIAHNNRIYQADNAKNRRSKNYATQWFSLGLGGHSGDKDSTFAMDSYGGAFLEYRYQFSTFWGLFVRARGGGASENILTSTEGSVDESAAAIGLNWRWMPFNNPMSFWGQSFMTVGLGAEYMRAKYILDDGNEFEDKDDSISALLRAQYHIPVVFGFWGFIEAGATHHNYEFEEFNVKSTPVQGHIYLGVTYGF